MLTDKLYQMAIAVMGVFLIFMSGIAIYQKLEIADYKVREASLKEAVTIQNAEVEKYAIDLNKSEQNYQEAKSRTVTKWKYIDKEVNNTLSKDGVCEALRLQLELY